MDNQIYRLQGTEKSQLEFIIIDTNDINPVKDIKEVSIEFTQNENYHAFSMELSEAKSLLSYLQSAIDYCDDFNKNSQPKKD